MDGPGFHVDIAILDEASADGPNSDTHLPIGPDGSYPVPDGW